MFKLAETHRVNKWTPPIAAKAAQLRHLALAYALWEGQTEAVGAFMQFSPSTEKLLERHKHGMEKKKETQDQKALLSKNSEGRYHEGGVL